MKRYLLLIVFSLTTLVATDAQGLYNAGNITNEDNIYRMEFNKSNNLTMADEVDLSYGSKHFIVPGGIITGLGVVIIFAGIMYQPGNSEYIKLDFGPLITGVGVIGCVIGVGLIIYGIVLNHKEKQYPDFEAFRFRNLKINPSIGVNQYNNTYNYGVTISFTF
jgi:hypothetical protein